jgi:hypothetical protein
MSACAIVVAVLVFRDALEEFCDYYQPGEKRPLHVILPALPRIRYVIVTGATTSRLNMVKLLDTGPDPIVHPHKVMTQW